MRADSTIPSLQMGVEGGRVSSQASPMPLPSRSA